MKRILCLLIITVLVSTMCSCSCSESDEPDEKIDAAETIGKIMGEVVEVGRAVGYKTDEDLVNERMEQLCTAIKKKDKAGIKDIFSKKAQKQSVNLDGSIEALLSVIGDEILSVENCEQPVVSEERKYSKELKSIYCWNKIITDAGRYLVFIYDYPIDEIAPENEGLYTIKVINEESKDALDGYVQDWMLPGIYVDDVKRDE